MTFYGGEAGSVGRGAWGRELGAWGVGRGAWGREFEQAMRIITLHSMLPAPCPMLFTICCPINLARTFR